VFFRTYDWGDKKPFIFAFSIILSYLFFGQVAWIKGKLKVESVKPQLKIQNCGGRDGRPFFVVLREDGGDNSRNITGGKFTAL
jgi:hypothetical protein